MLSHQKHAQMLAAYRNPAPRLYGLLDSAQDLACDLAIKGLISTLASRGVPYEQAVSLPYETRISIADKAMNAVPIECASQVGALLNLSPILSESKVLGWMDIAPKVPIDYGIVNVPNMLRLPTKMINVTNLTPRLSPETIQILQSMDPAQQEELFNVGDSKFDWKKALFLTGMLVGGASILYVIVGDQ